MSRYQSLCDYLAECGGIRIFAPSKMFVGGGKDRLAHGAGDLLSMAGDSWHKAKPFRKKLVRENSGGSIDDACIWAREGGYFYSTPATSELLDAISRELGGEPVYTPEDEAAMFERELMDEAGQSRAAYYDDGRESMPHANVELYERGYVNRKGKPGTQYLAKVTLPGERKPAFHTTFMCPSERERAVNAFLAGSFTKNQPATAYADCPF